LELDDMNEKIINSKANDSCTPLWTAAFNGRRDAVMLLLLFGADESIKGAPEGEPITSPALAARRNRQPGLADAIDLESSLRAADPGRRLRQLAKRMDRDEFKESIRSRLVAKEGPA
jgi:ankyrin repeat protein